MLSSLIRRCVRALLWFAAGSIVLVLVLRWVPPPGTALMVERKVQSWFSGEPIDLQRDWQPWQGISDDLKVAVIAGEDQKFASHWGFDIPAIQAAFAHNERGGNIRGASTLTQQVAKNLFLWPGRSVVRKGLEIPLAMWIDLVLSKARILEIYLNIAEMGPSGQFGAEAGAKFAFNRSATNLSARDAALLAAVLPNPVTRSAKTPGPGVRRLAATYQARAQAAELQKCWGG